VASSGPSVVVLLVDGACLISQERGLLDRGSANQEVLWSPIGPVDDSYLTTNWGWVLEMDQPST
jgi:hypothetical protein